MTSHVAQDSVDVALGIMGFVKYLQCDEVYVDEAHAASQRGLEGLTGGGARLQKGDGDRGGQGRVFQRRRHHKPYMLMGPFWHPHLHQRIH